MNSNPPIGAAVKRFRPRRAALVLLIALVAVIPPSPPPHFGARALDSDPLRRGADVIPMSTGTEDDPDARAEMEFMMLRDPRTGSIPRDILRSQYVFARRLPNASRSFRSSPDRMAGSPALVWTERGPNNVGGARGPSPSTPPIR